MKVHYMFWDDLNGENVLNDDEDIYGLRHFCYEELLQGDGWSDPNGRDMYSDLDYDLHDVDDDLDEWLEEALREIGTPQCRCDVDKIFDAADELSQLLKTHPQLFPRNHAQVEGFALPGRKTYGAWSRWVDYSRSRPKDFGNIGCISLVGCSKPGHSCRVLMFDDKEVVIDGQRHLPSQSEVEICEMLDDMSLVDLDAQEPDEEVLAMMEIAEELRYNERNFGSLHIEDLNTPRFTHEVDQFLDLSI